MSKRILQVNQLIKKELSKIILKEMEFSGEEVVTVTRVETSSDLNQTKVYISVFPSEKAEAVLGVLEDNIYDIQQRLNKRLKMRFVPKIIFKEEKETAKAGRVEELLEKLKPKE